MKILMMGNHESVHGGITSVIKQLLSHDWDRKGIEMSFLPTYCFNNKFLMVIYFLNALFKLNIKIKYNRPDIVHIHMSHTGSFYRADKIRKICKKNNIKLVVHLHGSEFEKFYLKSNQRIKNNIITFLKECDIIIALGESWRKFIISLAPDANVVVLNNSVCIPNSVVNQNVEKVGILFLGVLVERKGVLDLLKSINVLKNGNKIDLNKFTFKIAGTGNQEEKLKDYVKRNDLNKYVSFLGWIDGKEKDEQLKGNQIFVLPSYNEGLPIAILEAASYGMPIVATDVGSVKEAVIHGQNGYLVEPGDINGYVSAFENILNDHEIRKKMAVASRKLALDKFDEREYFNKLNLIYKDLNEGYKNDRY